MNSTRFALHFPLRLLALFLCSTLAFSAHAQSWEDLMKADASMDEVETAFRTHLTPFQLETGKGIKPFERMRYFWEGRMQGDGHADFWETYKRTFGQKGTLTKDAGNWSSLGMSEWVDAWANNPGNGRVNSIEVNPNNPDEVLVCTPSGGLWKSENGGDDWTVLTDNLPTLGATGAAIHPTNSDIIYLATGDGDGNDAYGMGVLKTTDGGETWNTTGMVWTIDQNSRCNGIAMHPEDPETLFVWSTEGLYKTVNGGLTWYLLRSGNVEDFEFCPSNPDVVYCCTNRFYKSTDGGEDFDLVNEDLPSGGEVYRMELAVSADDPDRVYILACNDVDYGLMGVYASDDQGDTWDTMATSPNILGWSMDGDGNGGQGWYDLDICANPNNADHIFLGGVNLWESLNGGLSWDINAHWVLGNTSNYVHADIHYLGYHGNRLWCGSDGGAFRSTNNGNSFQNKSFGLEIAQYYRFGMNPSNSGHVFAGAQDNGCNLRVGGDWYHILGADGMEAIIHPTNSDILFGASQYGGIRKSTNGGVNFDGATEGIDEDGAWVTPYIMSPVNSDVMIAGYENVWRSTDQAESWSKISEFDGAQFYHLAMSAANPNVIYAATNSRLYRTSDGGGEWMDITADLPTLGITYIAAHQSNADEVWVTITGFSGGNKVFRSLDGGGSWENVSGNLPNIPANCIVLAEDSNDGVYVGTDFGVFYTDNNLANWESFNSGLPHVRVTEMMINTADDKLVASTFGRGMWISDLWEPMTTAPEANATTNTTFICAGDSIFFQDASTGNAPGWNWTFDGGAPASLDMASGWVVYPDAGTFGFSLETSNDAGSDTYTCDGCIFVYDTLSTETTIVEGFEYPDLQFAPGVWTANEDAEGNGWKVTNQASYGGDHSAWLNNYVIDINAEYELISQPYALDTANTYLMTYRVAYAQVTDDTNDRLRIYTSTDCGATWTLRDQVAANNGELQGAEPTTESYSPQTDEWQYFELELTDADISDHTQFRFLFLTDNGNNVYLDNINLTTVGVSEQVASSGWLKAYPNPGAETCTLEFPGNNGGVAYIQVMDAMGRGVMNQQFATQNGSNRLVLNTQRLAKGWYRIRVRQGMDVQEVTWVRR